MTTNNLWKNNRLGVIGGGNMAEALVRGAIDGNVVAAGAVTVYDPVPERRRIFADLGCAAAEGPGEALRADVVLLAVKPQKMREAAASMMDGMRPDALVVSILAGISIARLSEALPRGAKIVRVMPNTPLLVGLGVSALAPGPGVGEDGMALAASLFSAAGKAYRVEEGMLDAVTALSGSGPAYVFRFVEAMADAGVSLGLPRGLATELATGTLRGSAEMLARFGDAAGLRVRVTSPGGTTEAALAILERHDFSGLLREAMAQARNRSIELGREA